jgi:hypothetical protein
MVWWGKRSTVLNNNDFLLSVQALRRSGDCDQVRTGGRGGQCGWRKRRDGRLVCRSTCLATPARRCRRTCGEFRGNRENGSNGTGLYKTFKVSTIIGEWRVYGILYCVLTLRSEYKMISSLFSQYSIRKYGPPSEQFAQNYRRKKANGTQGAVEIPLHEV